MQTLLILKTIIYPIFPKVNYLGASPPEWVRADSFKSPLSSIAIPYPQQLYKLDLQLRLHRLFHWHSPIT